MADKMKLIEHRRALAENDLAYSFELREENIHRLVKTLMPHLKNAGFSITLANSFDELLSTTIRNAHQRQLEMPIPFSVQTYI